MLLRRSALSFLYGCRIHFIALLTSLFFLLPAVPQAGLVQAQEKERAKETEKESTEFESWPLAVYGVASIERILEDADYLFELAGRPEISDLLGGALANVRDFKGLDRTKPVGMMVFLKPGIIPTPFQVGFIPISDIGEATQSLTFGPFTVKKTADGEGTYSVITPGNTLSAVHQGDYLYITNEKLELDREFTPPHELTKGITNRLDFFATANLKSYPEGLKTLFLTLLRANSETELQQRDDEPSGAYKVRKANGQFFLELIEGILADGDSITFGLATDEQGKEGVIELNVSATPDSKFAKRLKDTAGKPSRFSSVINSPAPLTFSTSWTISPSGKKTLKQTLAGAEEEMTNSVTDETVNTKFIADIFESINETVDLGHLDGFVQFLTPEEKDFVLIGGIRIAYGNTFGAGLRQALQFVQQQGDGVQVDLEVDTHAGVILHRLTGKDANDRDKRMYGGVPSLYVGTGAKTLWFAVGKENAIPALKTAMDLVTENKPGPLAQESNAPFQLRVSLVRWLALMESPRRMGKIAKETLQPGNDGLLLDFRPTDNGARFRLTLNEGFLKVLGTAIAARLDRQFQP
jgi:hypothetical protein